MMSTTIDIVAIEVPQDFSYADIIEDQRTRDWAMAAAGTIRSNISGAVKGVLESGFLLQQAREKLPHGAYLPWLQQECRLKPRYAQRLIKAAEWVNAAHAPHLEGVTDATTLFMLCADTTPEEVREWFMERCAAGEPPSRKEVQERKNGARGPRQPQAVEALALSIIRKDQMDALRRALTLAERASVVSAADVMAEQRLRDLGKLRYIPGVEADFHRLKTGSWIRLPHAGDVDTSAIEVATVVGDDPDPPSVAQQLVDANPQASDASQLLPLESAAKRFNMTARALSKYLTPADARRRNGKPFVRGGFRIDRDGPGRVRLTPIQ